MPILIDGHNLIGRLSSLSLADADDEEALVRLLQSYRARSGKTITVVFDPGVASALSQSRRVGGVQVVYAGHGGNADDVIARRVGKSQNRQGWLVVTSDRDLSARVASLGARVQTAEAFASELEQPAGGGAAWREQPLSPEEVDRWLAVFDNDDESHGAD